MAITQIEAQKRISEITGLNSREKIELRKVQEELSLGYLKKLEWKIANIIEINRLSNTIAKLVKEIQTYDLPGYGKSGDMVSYRPDEARSKLSTVVKELMEYMEELYEELKD